MDKVWEVEDMMRNNARLSGSQALDTLMEAKRESGRESIVREVHYDPVEDEAFEIDGCFDVAVDFVESVVSEAVVGGEVQAEDVRSTEAQGAAEAAEAAVAEVAAAATV